MISFFHLASNPSYPNTTKIDLHGLYVNEAIAWIEKVLQLKFQDGTKGNIEFITGTICPSLIDSID